MTIEILHPETEALIEQRMASGAFHNVEDALFQALKVAPAIPLVPVQGYERKTLREVFEAARGLGDGLDIRRDPSPGRPVEL